jgi:hypothetical protein
MWPARRGANDVPHLPEVVEGLRSVGKTESAAPRRLLARRARRDRPLGAAEADHRLAAHRRLRAPRQDGRRQPRRRPGRRGRAGLARAGAALCHALRLAGGQGPAARGDRSRALPAAHAVAPDRGRRFRQARPGRIPAEWKWDGIRVQAVTGTRPDGERVTRFIRAPARTSPPPSPTGRGADAGWRARRRTAGAARGGGPELQQPAAAAQPQERDVQDAARAPRPYPRLRPARRW